MKLRSGLRGCDSSNQSCDLRDRTEVGLVWEGFWGVDGVAGDFEAAEDAGGSERMKDEG